MRKNKNHNVYMILHGCICLQLFSLGRLLVRPVSAASEDASGLSWPLVDIERADLTCYFKSFLEL